MSLDRAEVLQALRRLPALLIVILACCAPPQPASVEKFELSLPESGIPLNQFFSLEIRVLNETDLNCEVKVDADMPAHGHGMIVAPTCVMSERGLWQVDGMKFHMPGDWEIYVDLVRGEEVERHVFPVTLDPF